jgi:hypothetical protein
MALDTLPPDADDEAHLEWLRRRFPRPTPSPPKECGCCPPYDRDVTSLRCLVRRLLVSRGFLTHAEVDMIEAGRTGDAIAMIDARRSREAA